MPRGQKANSFDLHALLELARQRVSYAYCPYSEFPVAAAVLADDGRTFTGVNVENVSYGLTICAERNAVFAAVAQGVRTLDAIAVVAGKGGMSAPCGACRQVIYEFSTPDTKIALERKGGEPHVLRVEQLLPLAFTSNDLLESLKRQPSEDHLICVKRTEDVEYWSRVFDVTPAELKIAVRRAGRVARDVRDLLLKNAASKK